MADDLRGRAAEKLCSCDGDPIECGHEAARGQAEERARQAEAQVAALREELAGVGGQGERDLEEATRQRERAEQAEVQVAALQQSIQHLAAEAHRRKWVWEDTSLGAFEELHRIGNELLAALPSRPDDPEEIRRLAESTEIET